MNEGKRLIMYQKSYHRVVFFILMLLYGLTGLSPSIFAQTTLVIESLPNTTPQGDSIFVCGTFNNWDVHDLNYLLHKQINGKYAIIIPKQHTYFEYKFSRGSWVKVETNKLNDYIKNRVHQEPDANLVYVTVANWQDLGGGKKFNYFVLWFFAMALLGFVFLFSLLRIERSDKMRVKIFLVLNTFLIASLLGAVLYEQSNLIWQSYFNMVSHVLLFAWGPVLYLFVYIHIHQSWPANFRWYFIPLIFVIVLHGLQLFNVPWLQFYSKEIHPLFDLGNVVLIILGLSFNLCYFLGGLRLLNQSDEINVPLEVFFLTWILRGSFGGLAILLVNGVLLFLGIQWTFIQNYTLFLVYMSCTIAFEFYFVWKYPELLRVKSVSSGLWTFEIIERIEKLMYQQKPFKNPELTVAELSVLLNIKPHVLSKILNEYYKKNFRDFINEYRVQEFIKMLADSTYRNYTFLALAHEVGFNSKSTFNLAFKKSTQLSPREYLSQNELSRTKQTS